MSEWLKMAIDGGHVMYFDFASFNRLSVIARGAYGEVSKAYWSSAEKTVALKTLYSDPGTEDDKSFEDFTKELQLLRSVDFHDNVIRFFGVTQDVSNFRYFMVLQFADGGNLRDYLRNNHARLDWPKKISMGRQIASGLKVIHERGIVHRDLHSKNILVHEERMMITDFGLSKTGQANSNSLIVGMGGYIEPQCFINSKYRRDKKSDIYSLGVLLWEISSGVPPFNNMQMLDIAREVASGRREIPVDGTPTDYWTLYESAWDKDPKERPDIDHIREKLEKIRPLPTYTNDQYNPLKNQGSPVQKPAMNNYNTPPDSNGSHKRTPSPIPPIKNDHHNAMGNVIPNQPLKNQIQNQGYNQNLGNPRVAYDRAMQETPPPSSTSTHNNNMQQTGTTQHHEYIQHNNNQGVTLSNHPAYYETQNQINDNNAYPPTMQSNPNTMPQHQTNSTYNAIQDQNNAYNQSQMYPPSQPSQFASGGYGNEFAQQNYYNQQPSQANLYPQQSQLYTPQSQPQSQSQLYPPQTQLYPPQTQPYPPQTQLYPPQSQLYPPQSQLYPPQSQSYPPQSQLYPPQSQPYPPQSQPYPPQSQPQSYPPQSQPQSYPPQSQPQSYPPQSQPQSYPPQSQPQSYPPQSQPQTQPYPPQSQPQTQPYPPQSQPQTQPCSPQSQPQTQPYSPQTQPYPPESQSKTQTHPQPQSSPGHNTRPRHPNYSEMKPCDVLREKYIEENQSREGYVEPKQCHPGLHVGAGDVVGLQYHLDSGNSVSSSYIYGYIPEPLVHIASAYCEGKILISMLKTLKQYGADFKKKINNKTALHRLFENARLRKDITEKKKLEKYVNYTVDAIDILCENGCLINACDKDNRTVLSYFLTEKKDKPEERQQKQRIITALLRCGANPNLSCTVKSTYQNDFYAPTALFLAVKYNWDTDVIASMMKSGADARIWDENKKMNILCLAVQDKKSALVKWLMENIHCLSDSRSIKMAKRHDPSFIGKITFTFKNGSNRKLGTMNNIENYPPKYMQSEEESEGPWFIEEIKKNYGEGSNKS